MRAVGDLSSAYGGVMVRLGSKLGLYKAMAGAGPLSARELSSRSDCAECYVSDWLNAQAAGGHVEYHAASGTYELSSEQALVLSQEESLAIIPPAWQAATSLWFDEDKTLEPFRTGKGVAWGDHDGRLYCVWRPFTATSIGRAWCPSGYPPSTLWWSGLMSTRTPSRRRGATRRRGRRRAGKLRGGPSRGLPRPAVRAHSLFRLPARHG